MNNIPGQLNAQPIIGPNFEVDGMKIIVQRREASAQRRVVAVPVTRECGIPWFDVRPEMADANGHRMAGTIVQ